MNAEILDLYFKARLEEFSKAVRHRNSSPHTSCRSDDSANGGSEKSGNMSGEDDEMESVQSRRTSGFVDDMEVNGSSYETQKIKPMDDVEGVRDMEGIDYATVSDLRLGAGAATVQEVASMAGEEWVAGVGSVVCNLRHIGFAAMGEEGYASAIYSLLKVGLDCS